MRQQTIRELGPELGRVTAAKEKLARTPDDADSWLVVGRYHAFARGDWAKGLAALAKGSDKDLKALAERELAVPSTADEQTDLAAAWWKVAEKPGRWGKGIVEQHAAAWYRRALPGLAPGLKRKLAEVRVAAADAAGSTPSGGSVTYTFADEVSLADFDIVGTATVIAGGGGGLELSKGTPAAATTKAIFGLPIRVEFDAYCMPGGVLDMAPRICAQSDGTGQTGTGFALLVGDSYNSTTTVRFFGNSTKLPHTPLKAKDVHRIVLSVDAERHAEAQFDGVTVFQGVVPADAKVDGHVVVNGGRGDVVYQRVVIRGKAVTK